MQKWLCSVEYGSVFDELAEVSVHCVLLFLDHHTLCKKGLCSVEYGSVFDELAKVSVHCVCCFQGSVLASP